MNDKISIVVPIYNLEDYLDQCILSIIMQTYSNLEIILVNDGSTDNSGKICDKYKMQNNRVVVIHQENQGVSIARNKGLDAATGEYIGFVDADDWIDDNMYEILYNNLIKYDADISMCRYKYINIETILVPKDSFDDIILNDKDILKYYLSRDHAENIVNEAIWNKLYRASLIKNIRFPDHQIYEDVIFTCKSLANAKRFVISSACPYNYKYRDNSITNQKISIKTFDVVEENLTRYECIKSMYPEFEPLCRNLLLNELLNFLYKLTATNNIKIYHKEIVDIMNIIKQHDIYNCELSEDKLKILSLLLSDMEKGFAVMKITLRRNRSNDKLGTKL